MSAPLITWFTVLALLTGIYGLYLGLFVAPTDYQQGESYRIIFIHVPAAWMALGTYVFIAAMSAVSLVWRHALADVAAQAAAPIGTATYM